MVLWISRLWQYPPTRGITIRRTAKRLNSMLSTSAMQKQHEREESLTALKIKEWKVLHQPRELKVLSVGKARVRSAFLVLKIVSPAPVDNRPVAYAGSVKVVKTVTLGHLMIRNMAPVNPGQTHHQGCKASTEDDTRRVNYVSYPQKHSTSLRKQDHHRSHTANSIHGNLPVDLCDQDQSYSECGPRTGAHPQTVCGIRGRNTTHSKSEHLETCKAIGRVTCARQP
ncbi:tumor necrosis factor receptor superfamily member 9 isoform X3 [Ursus arctos]|uniref:tumor necrosis factor receptor superfamily member 9 isoform X3 n=1 Tax=Ursus arctos TaxID=9644 RepID=UPI002546895B|nr:tumor necrosis factor receptor superfamily member 9 isoform X3 [Ursus arctos]